MHSSDSELIGGESNTDLSSVRSPNGIPTSSESELDATVATVYDSMVNRRRLTLKDCVRSRDPRGSTSFPVTPSRKAQNVQYHCLQ